jgi:protein-tyrosine phosphatase
MRGTTYARANPERAPHSLWRVIDLHSHVLPGLDDGPEDVAGAVALARAAERAGTQVLVATPHISHEYAVDPLEVEGRVEALRAELVGAGVGIALATGGELAPERAPGLDHEQIDAIRLGDGDCVLLECPFVPSGALVELAAERLWSDGLRVLLAHPERSPVFLRRPDALAAMVARGALVQLTAGSLRGDFGRTAQGCCHELLDRGLVHVVASDAHDAAARPPDLLEPIAVAVRNRGLPPLLVDWLTRDVPLALLTGDRLPARPAGGPPPRRRRWSLLR